MPWLELIKAFLQLFISVSDTAREYAPTDKMKEDKAERQEPRMEEAEYTKRLKKLHGFLLVHPRTGINEHVDLVMAKCHPDDIARFKVSLHQLLPMRQAKIDARAKKFGVPKMKNPPEPPKMDI